MTTDEPAKPRPAAPVRTPAAEAGTATPRHHCDYDAFIHQALTKDWPTEEMQTEVIADVNHDGLDDYQALYLDRALVHTWIHVQEPGESCFREVYSGSGFVSATAETSGGWTVLSVSYVMNGMASMADPIRVHGSATASYDEAAGRYRWSSMGPCTDGLDQPKPASACRKAYEALKPK